MNPYQPDIHSVEHDLAGRKLTIETGRFAFQATGSATITLGDTVILATATISEKPREGCDFFPLTVDYEEKYYASGKIKGSRFIKREGRPSESAILRSRLIDRPIRPLFPKGMTNDVQIIASVISADLEVDPAASAINAASTALMMAGAPFAGPVGAVRVGHVEGQLILNPTYEQEKKGNLVLTVAGTLDAITMVEAGARELPEETMLEALELAHRHIRKICELQIELAKKVNPAPCPYLTNPKNESADKTVAEFFAKTDLDTVKGLNKKQVKEKIHALEEKLLAANISNLTEGAFTEKELLYALNSHLEKNMRLNILEKGERIDGRRLDEVRPLATSVGVLPRPHGTGLFQRGETQVLSIATLGSPGKAQVIDTMDVDEERFYMHHYNFPPFSTGEAKPMRGTSRREIGHGDLAERSLVPVLPEREKFPYAIRVVSETLSCNGSSSMGSVCGSTLALMDAGVPIKRPVSAVAMGLVTDKNAEGKFNTYKILTDIQGLEDFAGDMDFKVAGTSEGLTALQMDIKVKGISLAIMREALSQASKARAEILAEMLKAIPTPREKLSKYAPLIETIRIKPEQIRVVIGKGGETIQGMCAEFGVEIDIDDDGLVFVTAPNQEQGQKAVDKIKLLTTEPEVGMVFEGKVVRTMDFGAFVELFPGKDGMLHISALQPGRTNRVEDVVKIGDTLKVKLLEVDAMGRMNLGRVMPDGTILTPAPKGPPRDGGFTGRPARRF